MTVLRWVMVLVLVSAASSNAVAGVAPGVEIKQVKWDTADGTAVDSLWVGDEEHVTLGSSWGDGKQVWLTGIFGPTNTDLTGLNGYVVEWENGAPKEGTRKDFTFPIKNNTTGVWQSSKFTAKTGKTYKVYLYCTYPNKITAEAKLEIRTP